jgi:hypothetical protein
MDGKKAAAFWKKRRKNFGLRWVGDADAGTAKTDRRLFFIYKK